VATFLVFSDYLKGSIRLSALMNVPLIYILTHDSIAVGEDGPTHQPIEQLTMLRAIPNLTVFRPAGKDETTAAWYRALQNEGPTVLALSRQSIASDETKPEEVARGAYIVRDVKAPDVLIMASGSELPPALKAASLLEEEGIRARVVSMVSMELFEQQSAEYKEQLLPQALRKRVAVEAASPIPWYRYTGLDGLVIGMDQFGASAPGQRVLDEFGFTPENIKEKIKQLLKA
jgi:transketolase